MAIIDIFRRLPYIKLLLLFGVFLGCMVGFVGLADEVLEGDTLVFDAGVLRAINTHATPFWDTFFTIVTQFGDVIAVSVITALLCAILIVRKAYRKSLIIAVSVGGAALLSTILKLVFERPRPDLWEQLVTETSFSFPSGHSVASSALAFSLIVICWHSKYRWYIVAAALTYMVLIGLSRLYLGVHYPTDVLAGWLMSGLWVTGVGALLKDWRATPRS